MLALQAQHRKLLEEIYYATASGGFITYDELQNNTGMNVHEMQPYIEDLKENILIFQSPEGFHITPEGNHYAKSRWV